MRCSTCDVETLVIETRKRADGVYRRRRCPKCGARVTTIETVINLKPGPKSQMLQAPAKLAKPAKTKRVKSAPRKVAQVRRVDDFWMRNETYDYSHDDYEDLKGLRIDISNTD